MHNGAVNNHNGAVNNHSKVEFVRTFHALKFKGINLNFKIIQN